MIVNDLFDNALAEFSKAIDALEGKNNPALQHISRGLAELTEALKAEAKQTRKAFRDIDSDIKSIR